MYKIKQIPEDFIVKEINRLELNREGKYYYFLLRKRDYNTLKAIELIAKKLNIALKNIKFAGNKDKKAVTEQFISVNKKIKDLELEDLELKFIGRGNEPVSLGSHEGNYFEVTIRNLNKNNVMKKRDLIKNYFGEQRFGKNNVETGRNIIKRNFKEAVKLIGLKRDNNDYIGALRKLPVNLLKLYIHAYQAYLFNEIIKRIDIKENMKIPLIGFEFEVNKIKNKKLKNITNKIMEKDGITPRDFIIREMPELSSEGGYRDLFMEIKNLEIGKLQKDELNKGKYKIKLKFILDKGCYATVVIKELFKAV